MTTENQIKLRKFAVENHSDHFYIDGSNKNVSVGERSWMQAGQLSTSTCFSNTVGSHAISAVCGQLKQTSCWWEHMWLWNLNISSITNGALPDVGYHHRPSFLSEMPAFELSNDNKLEGSSPFMCIRDTTHRVPKYTGLSDHKTVFHPVAEH